ncbi:hypothetical protein MARPO_0013s0091 [Marchantia polymorpha]|uniref:Uncharacterized protein n=1 Tax=Marchantia polymorpha TaxID=3197 RepID=A0A2R6XIC7_MARPO|nr:hypothetical protein MARPO_0013s0091 [Marchantia polymorpha]|eukprot:PTQ45865.1 hypothetical protein MARPO_0013s0091 [Marchantia polymorpha]
MRRRRRRRRRKRWGGGQERHCWTGGRGKGREGDSRGQGEAAACPRQTATNRSSGRELKLTNKGESGAGPLPGRSCARTERGEGRCRAERVQPTVAQCAAIVTACALSPESPPPPPPPPTARHPERVEAGGEDDRSGAESKGRDGTGRDGTQGRRRRSDVVAVPLAAVPVKLANGRAEEQDAH